MRIDRNGDVLALDENEWAVLELLAMRPHTAMSPLSRRIARGLSRRGLVLCEEGTWHATARGLTLAGRTLH
jgi:hypothetical protein